ncbi:hypothetical protein [Thermochromatium tepidum]|jgi:hypothetical protein|uniref:Uncharacterized protein n=1 Tax=Thermochromatium tepidum ATCC 43061 TaxID=316276 RepID=A0A6I6EEG3_THETI|nr:hypothetical protein [Thermochromatium tepidum]QGU32550.1 hypothetical protein E6P07_05845 [Thermochromatium tepidum ATCC 43061]
MTQRRWPTQLAAYPYAQPLLIGWQIADRERDVYWNDYEQALDAYLATQDQDLTDEERQRWLALSREGFQSLAARGDRHIGTSLALIRIHSELGEPQAVIQAIEQMLEIMPWMAEPLPDALELHVNRPFLAPLARFEQVQILEGELGNWIQSGIQAALEAADRAA